MSGLWADADFAVSDALPARMAEALRKERRELDFGLVMTEALVQQWTIIVFLTVPDQVDREQPMPGEAWLEKISN